jgi:hypothetical protein
MPRTHNYPTEVYFVAGESYDSHLCRAIVAARALADTRAALQSPGWRAGVPVRDKDPEEGRIVFVARPTALALEGLPDPPPTSAAKVKKA